MKKVLLFYLFAVFLITYAIGEVSVKAAAGLFTDGGISGEINVHCYDEVKYASSLKEAAKLFEQKYPDTKVNINEFSTLPNDRSPSSSDIDAQYKAATDYITRVNVEMMSGGGADIYAIDVLPVYKYADSSQFVDLREFMDNDPDFDYGDYQKSIFDAVMYRGGQYILPSNFFFYILSYDTQLMDENSKAQFDTIGKYTYYQLFDIAEDSFLKNYNEASPIRMIITPDEYNLFRSELLINYNVFVDGGNRKANFTDGKFAEMLNSIKEYGQKGYINSADLAYLDTLSREDLVNYLLAMGSMKAIYTSTTMDWFLRSMISEEPNANYKIEGGLTKGDEIIGLHADLNGNVTVNINDRYAMNANSKNKRTAWEFMKFLISEEMQTTPFAFTAAAVNKNAFAANAKTVIYNMLSADCGLYDILPEDAVLAENQQLILDRYMDYMEAFLPIINTQTDKDIVINEMIESEVKKFFDGIKTADEVAATLQSRIEMYLQE